MKINNILKKRLTAVVKSSFLLPKRIARIRRGKIVLQSLHKMKASGSAQCTHCGICCSITCYLSTKYFNLNAFLNRFGKKYLRMFWCFVKPEGHCTVCRTVAVCPRKKHLWRSKYLSMITHFLTPFKCVFHNNNRCLIYRFLDPEIKNRLCITAIKKRKR